MLYLSSGRITTVYISLYENDRTNVYLHNNYFSYLNDKLLSYIDMLIFNIIQNKSISPTNIILLAYGVMLIEVLQLIL